jgi:hypothetical protein
MKVFSVKHNFTIQVDQLHVSVTVSSHHQADPNINRVNCTSNVTVRRVHEIIVPVEKQYYIFLCARVLPHLSSMQLACPILLYVASLAPPYFSTLTHKGYDFRGKKWQNIKCVFSFSLKFYLKHFPL